MKNLLTFLLISFFCLSFNSCSDDEVSVDTTEDKEVVEEYVPDGTLDREEDVLLKVASATSSSCQPNMGIELTIDGDKKTLFNAGWDITQDGYFPVFMDYNFQDVEFMDYCVYYSRPTGTNGNFEKVEVWYTSQSNAEFVKCVDAHLNGAAKPSIINFPERIEKPQTIRFIIREKVAGNGAPVCAEMEFYQRGAYDLNFELLSIFKDKSCSEIRPEVTETQINNMDNDFFRNLAMSVYKKGYPAIRCQQYKPYVDPKVLAAKYKTGTYSLRDNPTGIYVDAEDDLYVMVDGLKEQNVFLLVQDLEQGFGGESYPLIDGINSFKVKNKGLIYVIYYTVNGNEEPVKINIATGKINGVFRKGGTVEEWNELLNKAVDKHLDVVGEDAHLTFPVASFKEFCKDGNRLIEQYDQVVRLQKDFMGMDIPNRMYFKVSYKDGVYMHSTGYRTVYHLNTMGKITDESKFAENVWGPAHEVGHSNQTRPGLKWAGTTEVTNNIQSLFVQTSFGEESRLLRGKGEYPTTYEQAFSMIMSAHAPHSLHVKEFFVKLVPFWQLQLYYSEVKGMKDYYKKIYEYIRNNPDPATDGACQIEFVKTASIAAGEDLTEFFDKWGVLLPVDMEIDDYGVKSMVVTEAQISRVRDDIKALNLPKPKHPLEYITDVNVAEFKSGSVLTKGSASKSGSTITFSGWENVAAFEIYSDGTLLKATQLTEVTLNEDYPSLKFFAVAMNGERIEFSI